MTGPVAGHDPDGFIMLHHPADGGEPYAVGPFPPFDDLIEAAKGGGLQRCTCRIEFIWLGFPKGTKVLMLAFPEFMGDDEPEGPVH